MTPGPFFRPRLERVRRAIVGLPASAEAGRRPDIAHRIGRKAAGGVCAAGDEVDFGVTERLLGHLASENSGGIDTHFNPLCRAEDRTHVLAGAMRPYDSFTVNERQTSGVINSVHYEHIPTQHLILSLERHCVLFLCSLMCELDRRYSVCRLGIG